MCEGHMRVVRGECVCVYIQHTYSGSLFLIDLLPRPLFPSSPSSIPLQPLLPSPPAPPTLSNSIIFFMRPGSPSRVLALAQSGRTLNRMQIDSITVFTNSGGLLNTRTSAMSLLSRAFRAWKEVVHYIKDQYTTHRGSASAVLATAYNPLCTDYIQCG